MCEWHLGRNLGQHLPDGILADRWHPITKALPNAFHSLEGWERLAHAIDGERTRGLHRPLALAVKWLDGYGLVAKAQIATGDPRGINLPGPVEQILRELDRRIGDRVGSFTNRTRLAKLLDLMTLDLLGKADGCDWADRLRERLYLAGGRPKTSAPTTIAKASTPCSSDPKNVSIRIE